MKFKKILLIVFCLFFLSNIAWSSTTYYLCPTGEECDVAPDYNSFSVLQTNAILYPDDIIDGQGKTYSETWTVLQSGDSTGDITIRNATIDAQGRDFGVLFDEADYITLQDIKINTPDDTGILVGGYWLDLEGSDNITINNCIVENSQKRGILVGSGSDNVAITNSAIINPAERGIFVWAHRANINSIIITDTEITKTIESTEINQHGIHLYTEGEIANTEISDILISSNTITLGNSITGEKHGDFGIWLLANGPKSVIVDDVQIPLIYFYDLEISDNTVSYGQSGGVGVGNVSTRHQEHNLIQRNKVHNNGPDDDIDKPSHSMGITMSDTFIVSNNTFHDNLSNWDGVGVFLDKLSSRLIVRYNTTYGHNYATDYVPYSEFGQFNSSGIGICCGAHDNEVYYNISYGNTIGISLSQSAPVNDKSYPENNSGKIHHIYNNKIYNNIFAFNEIGIVNIVGYIPQWALNQGGVEVIPENCDATNNFCNEIKNNIIFGNNGLNGRPGAGMWTRTGATSPFDEPNKTPIEVSIEDSNIFFGNAEDSWSNGTNLSNNTIVDPQFIFPFYDPINPATIPDFHLKSESSAIDAGLNVGLVMDYDRNRVPYGPKPDIGAYEYSRNFPASQIYLLLLP